MVQWLGLHAFIARLQVQSLVRELRPCKPGSMAKKKKKKNKTQKTNPTNAQTEPRSMKLNSPPQDRRQGLAKSEFEPRAVLTPVSRLLIQLSGLSVTAWELSALSPHLTRGCFLLLITVQNNHHVKENFRS